MKIGDYLSLRSVQCCIPSLAAHLLLCVPRSVGQGVAHRQRYQQAHPHSASLPHPCSAVTLLHLPTQPVNLPCASPRSPGISDSSLPKHGWDGRAGLHAGQRQNPLPAVTLADTTLVTVGASVGYITKDRFVQAELHILLKYLSSRSIKPHWGDVT